MTGNYHPCLAFLAWKIVSCTHESRNFRLVQDHEILSASTRNARQFPFVDLISFRFDLAVPAFTSDGKSAVRQPTERSDAIYLFSVQMQQLFDRLSSTEKKHAIVLVCVRRGNRFDYLFFLLLLLLLLFQLLLLRLVASMRAAMTNQ